MANERLVQPFTEPVSAWDVLERIKALAADEPLRVMMHGWLQKRDDQDWHSACRIRSFPRCGTVGCVGGWGSHLLRLPLGEEIRGTLGLSSEQSNELFTPVGWFENWGMEAQTPEFAARFNQHISTFQRKYEQQLKDHMCVPVLL